jgi:hypothetical protein
MKRAVAASVFATCCLLFNLATEAAVVTVDVTIKAVNPQGRSLAVLYKAKAGPKTIELDVARKAEITVNGKQATLGSLKPGQKATVSYETELSIITKIEATGAAAGAAGKAPELVEVSKLNEEGRNEWPSLTKDGLTIYWTRNGSVIWTAHPDDSQSFFTDKKQLFKGRMPSISSDGLEMILASDRADGQQGDSLHVTTKTAPDKMKWTRLSRPRNAIS